MVFPRASLPEFDDGNVPPHGLVAVRSYPPPVTPFDRVGLVRGIP